MDIYTYTYRYVLYVFNGGQQSEVNRRTHIYIHSQKHSKANDRTTPSTRHPQSIEEILNLQKQKAICALCTPAKSKKRPSTIPASQQPPVAAPPQATGHRGTGTANLNPASRSDTDTGFFFVVMVLYEPHTHGTPPRPHTRTTTHPPHPKFTQTSDRTINNQTTPDPRTSTSAQYL